MRENYAFRMKQQIKAQKEKLGEPLKSKAKLADMSNIVFEDEDKIKEVVENGFDDFLESLRNGR